MSDIRMIEVKERPAAAIIELSSALQQAFKDGYVVDHEANGWPHVHNQIGFTIIQMKVSKAVTEAPVVAATLEPQADPVPDVNKAEEVAVPAPTPKKVMPRRKKAAPKTTK